jgi:hypothetical protein
MACFQNSILTYAACRICARRKEPLEGAAAEIARATNRKIVAIPADLTKPADAQPATSPRSVHYMGEIRQGFTPAIFR